MQDNHISSAINVYLENLEFKIAHPDEIRGLPTGLKHFDKRIDGIKPGELILIGGRPAMGKTSLAVNIAHSIARYFSDESKVNPADDRSILYFNLEHSSSEMMDYFIALNNRFSRYSLKKEFSDPAVQESIQQACVDLAKLPIYFSRKAYDINEIKEEIQKTSNKKQVGCIIIDCLQLVGRRLYRENYTEFLEQLKDLVLELDIPAIVLTQLTRDVESRSYKMPILSDIRGFNKNQDAVDKIIFIYREHYYIQWDEPQKKKRETDEHFAKRYEEWQKRCEETKNECRLIVAKNKTGPFVYEEVKFFRDNGKYKDCDEYFY